MHVHVEIKLSVCLQNNFNKKIGHQVSHVQVVFVSVFEL